MSGLLEAYAPVTGGAVLHPVRLFAAGLQGRRVLHVSSTRVGGGVAEILAKMIPLMQELGLQVDWEVITGESDFYQCTKSFHNALQGDPVEIPQHLYQAYEATNQQNAERLRPLLEQADFGFIHDPQPAMFLKL